METAAAADVAKAVGPTEIVEAVKATEPSEAIGNAGVDTTVVISEDASADTGVNTTVDTAIDTASDTAANNTEGTDANTDAYATVTTAADPKKVRKKSNWGKSVSRKFLVIALAGTVLLNAALTAGMLAAFNRSQAKRSNSTSGFRHPGSEQYFGGDQGNSNRMMPPDGGQDGRMMPPGSSGDTDGNGNNNGFGGGNVNDNGYGSGNGNAFGNQGDAGTQQSSKVSIGIVIRENSGVYVAQVNGDNAKKAGFKEGDKIVSFDGKDISTGNDLITAVQSHKSGDKVSVVLERDGKEVKIETELE